MHIVFREEAPYPDRLLRLKHAPTRIWIEGELKPRPLHVAIVGSRKPIAHIADFVSDLAAKIAAAGAVVVSGGALGVDAAAHRGALAAKGITWAVLPSGHARPFPPEHAGLFQEIARSGGRTIALGPPEQVARLGAFHRRNAALIALSDVVIIVQAARASGTRNAAKWARKLGKPLWILPGLPWLDQFAGSVEELLHNDATPFLSSQQFLHAMNLDSPQQTLLALVPKIRENPAEKAILDYLTTQKFTHAPHLDEIADETGLPVAEVATALLTLALEDVVVEGPERCFQRKRKQ